MRKLKTLLTGLLLLTALLCLAQLAFAAVAKITDVRVTQFSGLTRFVFEINGAYRYQWKLEPNLQQLTLKFDGVSLATPLPITALADTVVKSLKASPLPSEQPPLSLSFQLKTIATPKIYSLPPSGTTPSRLVVELKSAATLASRSPAKNTPASVTAPPKPVVASAAPTKTSVDTKSPLVTTTLPPPPDMENPPAQASKPKATLADKTSARSIIVVIDPGHGGKDSGAVGPGRTREKDVVLAISKHMQQLFNQQPGFQAQLTRSQDFFIPLRQRLAIARKCKADIFIAVHADAALNNDAVGASVFALSERGATSEGARLLAEKENESELLYGVLATKDQVLRSVLIDLSQTHTIAVSLEMGQEILHKLSNVTKLHYARVEQAAFVVLKSPDIPSLLVETGYVTNPIQEQKLRDPAYQQQLAEAIVQGVMAYFVEHPPNKRLITT